MDWNQTAWMVVNVAVCLLIAWACVRLLRFLNREVRDAIAERAADRETAAYDEGYRAGLDDSGAAEVGENA